jgi:signal transduction histidine kinase
MNHRLSRLARRYLENLQKFVERKREVDLEHAYELGREAIALKFGVLDMARIHQNALASLFPITPEVRQKATLRAAEIFFLDSLSPFEATHRGFCDTNNRLQRLIAEQEKRNQDLANINDKLTEEIHRRKRTEKALRQSESHFRRLFDDARGMEDALRDLSNKVLDVQEDERKRLSRELHDETGQALTAISVTLASLGRHERGGTVKQQRLRNAQKLLRSTMETIHDFARELRPAMLDELGLLPALRSYLTAFAERTGLRVHFRATPVAEQLAPNAKLVLFRVAQESLTNIAKHAQANRVDFRIHKVASHICMIIRDDGKSFRGLPNDAARHKQSLGLLGMQERVRLVNGQIVIRPQAGKGTTVSVAVPLNVNGVAHRNGGSFNHARVKGLHTAT